MTTRCIRLRRPPAAHRGQVLVLSLVLAMGVVLASLFMFSSGRLVAIKTRLVTAADAAAWSAGLWRARVLNYDAYANRAIVFQEVAIAQAVTLASWSRYFETFLQSAGTVIETAYPPAAPVLQSAHAMASAAREATQGAAALETWLRGAPSVGYKSLLADSQEVLQLSANVFGLGAVANEVAKANDAAFFAFALPDEGVFDRLTRRYQRDADRARLKSLVLQSLDTFVAGPREFDLRLPLPSSCFGQSADLAKWFQSLRKRGGTTLGDGYERWEAADTVSLFDWRKRGWIFGTCRERETIPLGWGASEASSTAPAHGLIEMPGGVDRTPRAAAQASSDLASTAALAYDGIARVRELDYERLDDPLFPMSTVSVLARIDGGALRSAQAAANGVGRLRLDTDWAGGRVWALSSAQVYFRKPQDGSGRIEYASLYNPYWQVRLAEPTLAQRALAEAHVAAH
jgi:hypothetical protein